MTNEEYLEALKKYTLSKQPAITEEQTSMKTRMAVCKACDFFNPTLTLCKKCGCVMSIKAFLPKSKCPIGKW